jgi:nucleoid-associated protein YgaU
VPVDAAVDRGSRARADVVLVAPGDTLWSIAAAHLPPDASDADVAAAVQQWYSANREVVGADPDLIRPGQHLEAPAGAA